MKNSLYIIILVCIVVLMMVNIALITAQSENSKTITELRLQQEDMSLCYQSLLYEATCDNLDIVNDLLVETDDWQRLSDLNNNFAFFNYLIEQENEDYQEIDTEW